MTFQPVQRVQINGRAVLAILTVFLSVVILGACSESRSRVGTADLGLASQSLAIGNPVSRTYIPVHWLRQGMSESDIVTIGDSYTLEFIPLARYSSAQAIETYAITDGRQDLLSSVVPISLESTALLNDPGAALAHARIRLDLSAYQGQEVRFKWAIDGNENEVETLLAGVQLRPTAPREAESAPDLLLICSDTHRQDYSVGGKEGHLMPFLHSLSTDDNAVVYGQAFSTASWTMPAVASVLTGLFPRYHQVGQRGAQLSSADRDRIPAGQFAFGEQLFSAYSNSTLSLPERLQAAGYYTALVASNPLYFLSDIGLDGNDIALDTGVVTGDKVNEKALTLIASSDRSRPLFLLVHYIDVHQWEPWYLKTTAASRDLDPVDRPAKLRDSYSRAVRDADHHLEALIEGWRHARNWDNSLIAFYSDHGESLLDPDEIADPGALRIGHGNSMSDALLRIPLMIKYPLSFSASAGDAAGNVSLVDLAPTLLDVAGINYEASSFSGRSLARLSNDKNNRKLYADFQLYGTALSSVRRGPYMAIIDLDKNELFLGNWLSGARMEQDSPDRIALGRELQESFESYRQEGTAAVTEHSGAARQVDQGARRAEQLRSLGYSQ